MWRVSNLRLSRSREEWELKPNFKVIRHKLYTNLWINKLTMEVIITQTAVFYLWVEWWILLIYMYNNY